MRIYGNGGFLSGKRGALLLGAALFALIIIEGTLLYMRSEAVMQQLLRQRLITAATLAAEQFDGAELDSIRGAGDVQTVRYKSVVERLTRIREIVPNISFAYIMRKTDSSTMLEFVADADSLATDEELDSNGNGTVDPDEEPSYPGEQYDISDIAALQGPAFMGPAVDAEITVDQWGELISGYAPVYRKDGTVAGIVGIDMNAAEFLALSRRAFSPLLLLVIALAGFAIASVITYVMWNRKREALRFLDSERSSLLELVSHQLGAPVASIKWWNEILADGSATPAEACPKIEHAAERMNDIIRALRQADHAEKGDESLKRESVGMSTIIHEAIGDSIRSNPDIEDRLTVDLPINCTVRINPKLIRGVIAELLENAVSYSKPGSPISVRLHCKGNWVTVFVEDKGCGIPERDRSRLFGRMVRGSNARIMKPDGNGLGLAICKSVVERAGGTMTVRSKEGEGSTFSFSLPVG